MDSDDDYSDLTDIESDYKEKGKKKTKETVHKNGGYKIKNALKVPRATTYTAKALYDQIHSSDINLEPEYQRDVVWPETKQIGIIDSIFRNFYIPPVIFAVNTLEDGSETRTCIDGKQRLTSIHRFMDGLIPHKDPLTGEKLWYTDVHTSSSKGARARKLLPEKYRRLFANKQIVCVEYQDITDGDEREIFQRVQLGMALTPAEKLQVINTPRAAFIREIQGKYLKENGGLAGDALEWDRGRGSDFRCLAQAVLCMEKFGPSLKTAGSIAQLEKWLSEDSEFTPSFRTRVQSAFQVFSDLALDKKLNKVFKKPAKISPIEFILISLLVAVHKDNMTKAQLSVAIGGMRDDVRDTHVDIRMNDRVARTMLEFIRRAKPTKIPGDVGEPADQGVGAKRKRTDEDDTKPKAKKGPPTPVIPSPSVPPINPPLNNAIPPPPRRSTQGNSSAVPVPDRMAAVRAAKIFAAQSSTQSLNQSHSSSSSMHPLQSNYSTPQLHPSEKTIPFNSQVGHHQLSLQPPQQLQQQQAPQSHLVLPPRPNDNRSRLEHPPPPYANGPSKNYDHDSGRDRRGSSDGWRLQNQGEYPQRSSDSGWGNNRYGR